MKRILSLAWRNLWRTPRRTSVTLAAMTLATFFMIVYTSLMQGYLRDLERDVVEVEIGDLQIHASGYLERPSLYALMEDADAVVAALEEDGLAAAPRLLSGALVAGEDNSSGALLRGVDVERSQRVTQVANRIETGQWLAESDPRGVVVGRLLARTLEVDLDDELVVLGQATDGSMANDLFRVRGVLGSVSEATDRAAVFLPEQTFRDLFGIAEGAHQILVRRTPQQTLNEASALAESAASQHDPRTWRELMPFMATMIDTASSAIFMVSGVIYIAIAILILNAMLMAVFERIRELGVLKAIGMSPRKILLLILTEALLQALAAVALSVALAAPALWYLVNRGIDVGSLGNITMGGANFPSLWRGAVQTSTFLGPLSVFFFLVLLGVLYPGYKAASISPVEAMRHN
ncbi:MAG: FtsX-like permease family protein [Acidobacteriota bacterium]